MFCRHSPTYEALVETNLILESTHSGITDWGESNNIIANTVWKSGVYGVYLGASANTLLVGNAVFWSGYSGLVTLSRDGVIHGNAIAHSVWAGIQVRGESNLVKHNCICDSRWVGLEVQGNRNKLIDNWITMPINRRAFDISGDTNVMTNWDSAGLGFIPPEEMVHFDVDDHSIVFTPFVGPGPIVWPWAAGNSPGIAQPGSASSENTRTTTHPKL